MSTFCSASFGFISSSSLIRTSTGIRRDSSSEMRSISPPIRASSE